MMNVEQEDLADHTWFKIGGPAELIKPTSKEELVDAIEWCIEEDREYRVLGNGSNVLISDDGLNETIIKNTNASTDISVSANRVTVGSSVLIPQFINVCVSNDLGGIEYLYSVPGTVGGALFMNAGRGNHHNETISNHLYSVEIHDGNQVRELSQDELKFGHRYSTFQDHDDWVILSATFNLPEQPQEEGNRLIKERMKKVQERERSRPNAGSVFKSGNRLPLHKIPPGGLSVGNAEFVSGNRICHDGNATSSDILRLVALAIFLNRLIPPFEKPEVEWEIWD